MLTSRYFYNIITGGAWGVISYMLIGGIWACIHVMYFGDVKIQINYAWEGYLDIFALLWALVWLQLKVFERRNKKK